MDNFFFPGNYDSRFVEQCSEVAFIRGKRSASRALGTPPVTNGGGGGVGDDFELGRKRRKLRREQSV